MPASFANVALTDTFDTWRTRTNQVITDINASTNASTANTIVRRDTTGFGGIKVDTLMANGQVHFNYSSAGAAALTISGADSQDVTEYSLNTGQVLMSGGLSVTKGLNVGGSVFVTGEIEAKGNIQLGSIDDEDDVVVLGADINSDVSPEGATANTDWSLGDGLYGNKRWKYGRFYRTVGANNTSSLIIPSGTTAETPTIVDASSGSSIASLRGSIRYNHTLSRYEGYNHTANTYVGLGGAVDADQDTKISLETISGSDEDTITFQTEGTPAWVIGNNSENRVLRPYENDTFDIGTTAKRVKDVWANNVFAHTFVGRDATTSLTLPTGTTAQRPSTDLTAGMIRFNTEKDGGKGALEYYSSNATNWYNLSSSAASYKTRVVASGSTTAITATYNPDYVDIFLNGVKLDTTDFTATSGSSIVLANAIGTGDVIDVNSIAVTDVSKAAFSRERFVASSGQTIFTTISGYTVGLLEVYANGTKIDQNDVTATDGSTFTLVARTLNDVIETIAFTSFENTDVYTKDVWANTAGNISVQSNTYINVDATTAANAALAVDSTNNRVGIGIKIPDNASLHVHKALGAAHASEAVQLKLSHSFAANATFAVGATGDLTVTPYKNMIVAGNLQVTGTTTTVDSSTMTVTDPLIVLNNFSTVPANSTYDTGLLMVRGTAEANVAIIWDESADEFVMCTAGDDGTAAGNMTITDNQKLHVGALECDDAVTLSSTLAVTGISTFNGQIGSNFIPSTNGNRDLGSNTKRWGTIYTSDLSLKNERGDWTVIEESDYLTLTNNNTGKRFKLLMEEIIE
jgi:hypothetical protein